MGKRTQRRDYGSGSVYQRSSDGRWIGTVELTPVGTRRRRKTVSGRTKSDVVGKMRDVEPATAMVNVPTLDKWLRQWLDARAARRAPKTLQTDRAYVETHIIPHLGRHKLDKLTPPHILRWHDTLRRTPKARQPKPPAKADPEGLRDGGTSKPAPPPALLEESTVLRAHAVLSRALTEAVRVGYIPHNPAQRVDRPGKGAPQVAFLDAEAAATLLAHVTDDGLGSLWAFRFLTGQRQGECLGLRADHLDLDTGLADVSWQLQRLGYRHGCDEGCGRRFAGNCPNRQLAVPRSYEHTILDGALCLTRPKAGRRKMVPLAPPLVAWLRRHLKEHPPGRHNLVWSRGGGRPIDPRRDYQTWIDLLDACHLPRVTLHSARHSCVTLLLSLGVQEAVIMQMVGHSTVAAARRYQHLDHTAAQAAATKLAHALKLDHQPDVAAIEQS